MECDEEEDDVNGDKENVSRYSLTEVRGDLFSSPASHSLAHCVSRDFRLGKGVAKLFRDKFGRVEELRASGAAVGEVAVLAEGGRFLYNLVTKEVYSGKPTYDTLRRSLERMREHAAGHQVASISMPRLGCGLDGLSWAAVRTLIKNVFQHTDLAITVYSLDTAPTSKQQTSVADMFSKGEKSKASDPSVVTTPKRAAKKVDVGCGYSTSNPLPDVFIGVKLHMVAGVEDAKSLERYVVAYGGQLIGDHQRDEATHVLYPDKKCKRIQSTNKDVHHVYKRWLEDCIKLKILQDERLYKIKK